MEIINAIIGILALIVAVIALIHSVYYNMVKIKLSNCIVDRVDKNYDWLYEFGISNLSNVSVIIKKIELFDKNGELLVDNGFDPFELHRQEERGRSTDYIGLSIPAPFIPLDPNWASAPFNCETEIFPASRENFSYYLDKPIHSIKITTNKRIYKFRKSQLFLPHFDNNG